MADETDYSSLPLEERLVHKVWKVRMQSYDELTEKFDKSRGPHDEIFTRYGDVDLYKKLILDANVVAQESGYKCFCGFLKYGATAMFGDKAKVLVPSICEKGLSSSRKNTKDLAIESILLLIELTEKPESIVEEIVPSLTHRMPKLVAGCVTCLYEIIKNYGCVVISPKPIVAVLPKLFSHADRTVRAETTKLAVELYVWMGSSLQTILFDDLKPIQQKDLTKAFEALTDTKRQQLRYTRKQQVEMQQQADEQAREADSNDVEMQDAEPIDNYDPLEFVDPVEVLSKLPLDLNTRITSVKWKDRKEVLEEVVEILEKAMKIVPNDDYSNLLRTFSKCMKDANIQVVQLAANCCEFIVKGLNTNFTSNYKSIILAPMIERTKEKKASVADALNSCLDAIFQLCGLSSVLDDILTGMQNKTPQIKISSTNYLQRCLASTSDAPTMGEIDNIMAHGVKLLSESQEPIRQASTEMIGTLMKITGERELNGFLEKVDDNRKAKVKAFFETVEVKAKSSPSHAKPSIPSLQQTRTALSKPDTKLFNSSSTSTRKLGQSSTVPVKRGATSPAKRTEPVKQSSFGRGLTGRSLTQLATTATNLRNKASYPASVPMEVDLSPEVEKLKQQINQLNQEKQAWLQQKQVYDDNEAMLKLTQSSLTTDMTRLQARYDELHRDFTNSTMLIKQKDTQINRLNNDLDGEKLKNKDLEQQIEMMKLQQNKKSYTNTTTTYMFNLPTVASDPKDNPDLSSPRKSTRITSGELSLRVNRLSIDGSKPQQGSNILSPNTYNRFESPKQTQDVPPPTTATTKATTIDFDSADDSWKRAAEVTSQLKARIEKMKARSRSHLQL
jgi:cytoskeleton-associated protein 5